MLDASPRYRPRRRRRQPVPDLNLGDDAVARGSRVEPLRPDNIQNPQPQEVNGSGDDDGDGDQSSTDGATSTATSTQLPLKTPPSSTTQTATSAGNTVTSLPAANAAASPTTEPTSVVTITPEANQNAPMASNSPGRGLAITGIVVGILGLAAMLVGIGMFFCWRRRRKQAEEDRRRYEQEMKERGLDSRASSTRVGSTSTSATHHPLFSPVAWGKERYGGTTTTTTATTGEQQRNQQHAARWHAARKLRGFGSNDDSPVEERLGRKISGPLNGKGTVWLSDDDAASETFAARSLRYQSGETVPIVLGSVPTPSPLEFSCQGLAGGLKSPGMVARSSAQTGHESYPPLPSRMPSVQTAHSFPISSIHDSHHDSHRDTRPITLTTPNVGPVLGPVVISGPRISPEARQPSYPVASPQLAHHQSPRISEDSRNHSYPVVMAEMPHQSPRISHDSRNQSYPVVMAEMGHQSPRISHDSRHDTLVESPKSSSTFQRLSVRSHLDLGNWPAFDAQQHDMWDAVETPKAIALPSHAAWSQQKWRSGSP